MDNEAISEIARDVPDEHLRFVAFLYTFMYLHW